MLRDLHLRADRVINCFLVVNSYFGFLFYCVLFLNLFLLQSSDDDDSVFVPTKKLRLYDGDAASGVESDDSEEVDSKVARAKPKGKKLTSFAIVKEEILSDSSGDDAFCQVVVDKTAVEASIKEKSKKLVVGRLNWMLRMNLFEPEGASEMTVATLRLVNDMDKDYFYFKARYFSVALQILAEQSPTNDYLSDIVQSCFELPMRKNPHGSNETLLSGKSTLGTEILCFKIPMSEKLTYSEQAGMLIRRLAKMLLCDAFTEIYQEVLKSRGSIGKMASDVADKSCEMWKCIHQSCRQSIAIKYYDALDAVFKDENIVTLLREMFPVGANSPKFFKSQNVLKAGWKSGVKPKDVY